MNKNEIVNNIISLYQKYGDKNYIGEEITQTEHAIQSLMFAKKFNLTNDFLVASLLHDIGHLMYWDDMTIQLMGDVGVKNHESIGSEYLKKCGFNSYICYLVGSHVSAKRYLATMMPTYSDQLSSASKATLKYQGSLMNYAEINDFTSNSWWTHAISLRNCDDMAKVKDMEVPDIGSFKELLLSVL